MVTRRRLLIASIFVLAVAQCLLWFVAAVFAWTFRDLLTSDAQVIAERTSIALREFAWLGLNILGLVAYAIRGQGLGRYVLAGIQSANAVITLAIGFEQVSQTCGQSGIEWFLLSGLAILTLSLQYVLWRRVDREIPPATSAPVHQRFGRLKSVFPGGTGVASLALIVAGMTVGAALIGLGWHLSVEGIQTHSGIVRMARVERGTVNILHLTLDASSHDFVFGDIFYEPLPDVRVGDRVVILTAESCGYGSTVAVQSQRGMWINSINDFGVRPFTPETWPIHEAIRWETLSLGVVVALFGMASLIRWIG